MDKDSRELCVIRSFCPALFVYPCYPLEQEDERRERLGEVRLLEAGRPAFSGVH
jgi:hypothetical protein